MVALDWALLAILLGSVLMGAWRGLVFEVLSLASWVLAFFMARSCAGLMADWLPLSGLDDGIRMGAGFVLVFIATVFVCGVVIGLIGKAVKTVGLRPFDRTFGAIFGMLRGFLLLLVVTLVFLLTPLRESPIWNTSVFAPYLVSAVSALRPWMPQDIEQHGSSLVHQITETGARIAVQPR